MAKRQDGISNRGNNVLGVKAIYNLSQLTMGLYPSTPILL